MKKIGILGGTFNPIHNGHIEMAAYCRDELGLDKIILIPDYIPPHKTDSGLADSFHRLNMCRLATEEASDFSVSTIEIERRGKSYTYETLTSLKELYFKDRLYFITGADMFLTLHSWRNPEIIFKTASIIAVPRASSDKALLEAYYISKIKPMGAQAYILDKPVTQVSSTYIRDNMNDYDKISPFISPRVYAYIKENHLYRK